MESFFSENATFISIFVTVDLIVFLLVLYFAKERREQKAMQQGQHRTLESEPPRYETIPNAPKFSKTPIRTQIGKSKILTNMPGKVTQIKITPSLIDMLRTMDTGSWFAKAVIKKFLPEDQLNELMDKALKGELQEGMVLTVRDGQITIEKDDPSVI